MWEKKMNRLANKQKKLFEDDLSPLEYEQKQKEFIELYYKLREKEANRWYSKLTLEQRKKIHPYILKTYKFKNEKISKFSYEVIKDERGDVASLKRPIIYALTHVGKFDIEVTSIAIQDHYYLLSGDFEHIQGKLDSPFLGMNGVFYFNEIVKEDRQDVSKRMIEHLHQKGNLMYFIEGTWNISPNLPMLPCYWGIIDVARAGNAIIVPVGVEQYGKKFKINIGKVFDVNLYPEGTCGKSKAIEDLRDILATLKWEIWETEQTTRDAISNDYWEKYVKARFREWPYFNEEYIKRLIYKPKGVYTEEEVFAPIYKLRKTDELEYVVKVKRKKVVAKRKKEKGRILKKAF